MRKRKVKRYARNEFRYNCNTKHINYIFEETPSKFHGIGITHRKRTFGRKNIPLDRNPQRNRSEMSYLRNGISADKKRNYSGVRKNFAFSQTDRPKVRAKVKSYKNNRRKNKSKHL